MEASAAKRVRVLFVCRENACRSQMAESFARQLGGECVEAYSAGSAPRGSVDAGAIAVMQEKGIALDRHRSKGLDALPFKEWDVMVTLGCGDACPSVAAKHRVDWQIPDPKNLPLEQYRDVRDKIEKQVKDLLQRFRLTGGGLRDGTPL